jgi:hypothetical protein
LAWLRIGEPIAAGRLVTPQDLNAFTTPNIGQLLAAAAAGVAPSPGSSLEQDMLAALLAGHCSDIASPQTGPVPDLVNVVAPREFLHLAKPSNSRLFVLDTAHCSQLVPPDKRQNAFRRLKKIDSRFAKVQQAINIARRSSNTVAPWSDTADVLRAIYGPCWLATDIAVIGAAIDRTTRRDLGTMDLRRAVFGPDIDYGRLVNDTRVNRDRAPWWLEQREPLAAQDRAAWAYALVAAATPAVVEACLSELAADLETLEPGALTALMMSSSRLGLSGVSRRLPVGLVAEVCGTSPTTGLMLAHHTDALGAWSNLQALFDPTAAAAAARFETAGWPALRVAGAALFCGDPLPWLAVLEAHGPNAKIGDAQGPLQQPIPDEVVARILGSPAAYPLQWVVAAELSRSHQNTQPPLLTASQGWFTD